jgi:DNA polymerase-3 subunit alpha
VLCTGFLKTYKEISTKKGSKMAFATFEDYETQAEVVVFPKLYQRTEQWLSEYKAFIIKGVIDESSDKCEIKAQECIPIDVLFHEWQHISGITLQLPHAFDASSIEHIKSQLIPGKTPLELIVHEAGKRIKLTAKHKFSCELDGLTNIDQSGVDITIHV